MCDDSILQVCKHCSMKKSQIEGRSHTSNQHFSLITFYEYQCCSSPRSNHYCITYIDIVNVIVRNNGNSEIKK